MRTWQRVLYWLSAGALVSFGLLSSVGLPALLAGAAMIVYARRKIGFQGVWAALVGFGAVPGGVVLYAYLAEARGCDPGVDFRIPPGHTGMGCSFYPEGYISGGVLGGVIVVVGIVWGMVELARDRRNFRF